MRQVGNKVETKSFLLADCSEEGCSVGCGCLVQCKAECSYSGSVFSLLLETKSEMEGSDTFGRVQYVLGLVLILVVKGVDIWGLVAIRTLVE